MRSSQRIELPRRHVRSVVQAAVALFVLSMVVVRYAHEAGSVVPGWWPDLHGLCPIGMVETLGANLRGDGFADAGRTNTWILMGALLTALLMGPVFCGWICPLGAVQDAMGRLGRRLLGRRYNRLVPVRTDRWFSWLRFAVLALVLATAIRVTILSPSLFNPSRALFHVWFGGAFPAGIAILMLTLAGSLVVARPWCRWLCPFGAVQGTVAKISRFTIRRNPDTCPSCARCSRACPMGVQVHSLGAVRDTRCNRCTDCLAACPVNDVLAYSATRPGPALATPAFADRSRGLSARVASLRSAAAIGLVATSLFFLPVAIARAAGAYRPAGSTAEAALTPEEISPTMTLSQVAAGLRISGEEILSLLEMAADFDLETRVFDIEDDERYEHITVAHLRRVLSDLP